MHYSCVQFEFIFLLFLLYRSKKNCIINALFEDPTDIELDQLLVLLNDKDCLRIITVDF